jgi:hypothetical protein
MLTTYYTRERTRTMYAAAPAGPYLDEFSQWLAQRGFTTRTIRRCLFGATQFTLWAAAAGIAVQRLDATHLEEFRGYLAQHGQLHYASGNPTPRCMGAHHFLAFLSAQGMVSAVAVAAPSSPPPTLLTAFEHWMDVHRGVTAQTLRNYRPILLDLLTTLDDRPEQLEAKSLRAFILARAHRHGKGKAKNMVTATRMFVRFLIANGRCAPGLDEAIPTIAMWRLSTLPQSSSSQIILAYSHVMSAGRWLHYQIIQVETRDVIKQSAGCNQFTTLSHHEYKGEGFKKEVAVGTVIPYTQRGNDARNSRWDRIERAELFERYGDLKAQGLSQRQAGQKLAVPRSTL